VNRKGIHELKFLDLSYRYENETHVFDKISFDFMRPWPVILQGPTGGGKNTLIKLLLGLLPIKSGHYIINGEVMNDLSFAEFDAYRLNMGYSFDVGGLINNRTLYENFILPLEYHHFLPERGSREYIINFFEYFRIDEYKHVRPAFVSSGIRKVATLIRPFLLDPEIIILNNPTLGLNSEHVLPLVQLIKEHQSKKNLKHLIVVTDDPHFIKLINGKIYQVSKHGLMAFEDSMERAA
jgi:phospholipid/cholesterol/gamma-HCH transport system ATP-binding protein